MVGVGVQNKASAGLPRADEQHQRERSGCKAQQCGEGKEGGEPAGAVKEIAVGGAGLVRVALADLQCDWSTITVQSYRKYWWYQT